MKSTIRNLSTATGPLNSDARQDKEPIDRLYASLMEEIKIRLFSCIQKGIDGRMGLHSRIVREVCFLQIRMVCESIALGCLLMHGDIKPKEAHSIRKYWSVERLMRGLEKLHPDFYPHPIAYRPRASNEGRIECDVIETGFMTKKELLKLNGKCGDALHRGTLQELISGVQPEPDSMMDIFHISQSILNLLANHWIALPDKNTHLFCGLRNSADLDHVVVVRSHVHSPP